MTASFPAESPGSRARLARLGPLGLLAVLALTLLAIFSLFRVAFLLGYLGRLEPVPGFLELLPMGVRFDLMTLGAALAPLALAVLVLPGSLLRRLRVVLAVYAAVLVALALFFELASVGFLDEYDSRPNRLFLEYLHKSDELSTTILKTYPLLVTASVLALLASAWFVGRASLRLIREQRDWSLRRRLMCAPLVLGALLVAAWGGPTVRGANRSTANFSSSHLANELVPNGLFTITCAAKDMAINERSPAEFFGDMPRDEVIARVRRWSGIPPEACPDPEQPLLHGPPAVPPAPCPYNLVIMLQESLGAQFVASLGGRPVTPNLEQLKEQGLWFTHMYSTGTRTVRGLEAVVCGFPPSPSSSVVKLGLAQSGFFTIAALLASQGYATDYLYGGKSEFDNMQTFLVSNGFQHAVSQDDFEEPEFVGTWGVCDEDLMKKANATFAAHGDEPFFALVLSTSNHTPFEFPDGKIELYDEEKATRDNSVKYADYAIGRFFELARREAYFARTIFLIVADHDTRAPSDDLLPVEHFHIPALLIGPGIAPRVEARVASQIDLMPTALHLLGLAPPNPMPGRDFITLPADDPGRALLQYYNVHGFLAGDQLVVHQPFAQPLQFHHEGAGALTSVPLDPELEKDARAHALLPWILYEEQRYRAP